jgi:hypothetical protein
MAEAATLDPTARLERLDRWNREETRGSGPELGEAEGHKHFGPVSARFGRAEHDRYQSLTAAVQRDGFIPLGVDGYIGAQVLVDGDQWVVVITGPGLHRTVVAAALGVDPLVVAVSRQPRLVHRGDAGHWPGVRCGLFTKSQALELFDRLMAGRPPARFLEPATGPTTPDHPDS